MLKRLATASVAAAMGASALLVAGPASATTERPVGIVSVSVSTGTVVVHSDKAVPVTAYVKTVNAKSVSIDIAPKKSSENDPWSSLSTGKTNGSPGDTFKDWSKKVEIDHKDREGEWVVKVIATGADGRTAQARAFFTVKHVSPPPRSHRRHSHHKSHRKPEGPRRTQLDLDVSPSVVRKHDKISLEGRLKAAKCYGGWHHDGNVVVLNPDRCGGDKSGWHKWAHVGGKKIKLYFQKRGHDEWEYVDSVTTHRDGTFHTKVRAYRSGKFKAVFKGQDGLRGSKDVEKVKVLR